MAIGTTAAIVGLAIAATASTATSVTASQRQQDSADKQKKLLGEKQATDALTAKGLKDQQDALALNGLAQLESKRKGGPSGVTLPGATPDQAIGSITAPAQAATKLIGA